MDEDLVQQKYASGLLCHENRGEEKNIIVGLGFSAVGLEKIAHCILVKLLVINIYFEKIIGD